MTNEFMSIDELINGWVLRIPGKQDEFFETCLETLVSLSSWVDKERMKEYKLLHDASGLQ